MHCVLLDSSVPAGLWQSNVAGPELLARQCLKGLMLTLIVC